MGRRRMMLVLAPLALVTLLGAAPWRELPSCVIGRFEGITSTDPNGAIVGVTDPKDWGCLGGASSAPADLPPVPPPTQVCFGPAYPNPTSGPVNLRFTLPQATQVGIVVYGQKHGPHSAYPVRTFGEMELVAGVHMLTWDGNNDQGARVPPGLYRAVLTVPGGSICGDIEIR
jgi:hypothetical protein